MGKSEVSLNDCVGLFQKVPSLQSLKLMPDDIKNGYLCAKSQAGSKTCQGMYFSTKEYT